MKKILPILFLSVCFCVLSACHKTETTVPTDSPSDSPSDVSSEEPSVEGTEEFILQFSPALTVSCRNSAVEALKGTTSWHYLNEDGNFTGIEADSMHPLQAKEYMTPLVLKPVIYSHIDPFAAYLTFEVAPDKIQVRCWREEHWGQFDAESLEIAVESVENTVPEDLSSPDFVIQLKDGNYIYEVIAEWSHSEKYGGTARYSFYTTTVSLEPHTF